MKKITTLLFACAMFFFMASCGNNDNAPSIGQPSASVQSPVSAVENEAAGEEEPAFALENANSQEEAVTGLENANSPSGSTSESAASESTGQGSNILVAYFSRVGNTDWEDGVDVVTSASLNLENGEYVGNAEYLAKMAQEVTGGDLFLIQTEETYPSDYRETTDVAADEQDDNARPVLVSHVENMDSYDTIVLIYPNWWGTLPQALFTFLEEYDFSGKIILPLCTHGGSRMGSSESAITELCPGATLLEGLAVSGSNAVSAQSDVETWIKNSGILE